MKLTYLSLFFLGLSLSAHAAREPLALIWKGPGVCKPNCGPSAKAVAQTAGLRVQYVYPGFNDYDLLERASVWIQPGGKSTTAAKAMGPELLEKIRTFVKNGGGYVGFCAGMFLATEKIGTSGATGLGLIPGETELFLKDDPKWTLLPVSIPGGTRYMYYAGGPFLKVSNDQVSAHQVSIIGRYANGDVSAIQSSYGNGRVAVSGFHPETSRFWKLWRRLNDPDGSDRDYAVEMIESVIPKN